MGIDSVDTDGWSTVLTSRYGWTAHHLLSGLILLMTCSSSDLARLEQIRTIRGSPIEGHQYGRHAAQLDPVLVATLPCPPSIHLTEPRRT